MSPAAAQKNTAYINCISFLTRKTEQQSLIVFEKTAVGNSSGIHCLMIPRTSPENIFTSQDDRLDAVSHEDVNSDFKKVLIRRLIFYYAYTSLINKLSLFS